MKRRTNCTPGASMGRTRTKEGGVTGIAIDSITVGTDRRTVESRTVAELTKSIAEIGLLNPIVVTGDGRLVAGAHRLEACRRLGWTTIPAAVVDLDELHAELAEIDENLVRNELSVLERSEAYARRKEIYEALHPEAKAKVAGAHASNRAQGRDASEIISPAPSFAADTAAKTGKSPRTIQHEVQIATKLPEPVREAIRHTPVADSKTELLDLARMKPEQQVETAQRIQRGEIGSVREAMRDIRHQERTQRLAEIACGNEDLPTAVRYPVIYADPPWRYEHVETESRAIENHYPTMSLEEICALPVADLATPDAVLFLWATSPKLAESMRVIESWGFTYRTCMVWVKRQLGRGYWARQKHELLLIATRGQPPAPLPSVRPASVVESDRTKHSAKPDIFAETIERMFPGLPQVEMFCRSPREGWSVWGNQAK